LRQRLPPGLANAKARNGRCPTPARHAHPVCGSQPAASQTAQCREAASVTQHKRHGVTARRVGECLSTSRWLFVSTTSRQHISGMQGHHRRPLTGTLSFSKLQQIAVYRRRCPDHHRMAASDLRPVRFRKALALRVTTLGAGALFTRAASARPFGDTPSRKSIERAPGAHVIRCCYRLRPSRPRGIPTRAGAAPRDGADRARSCAGAGDVLRTQRRVLLGDRAHPNRLWPSVVSSPPPLLTSSNDPDWRYSRRAPIADQVLP
jgi:hypothetical protein